MTMKEMKKMGEALNTMMSTLPEEEIIKRFKEATVGLCMKSLKEKDRDLKLTGNYKKCYDYLAEQFTRNYLVGKSISTVLEDTAGKFYNTWGVFLGIVEHFVKDGRKFGGIEDIINNSGISRKTWVKFLDYYFS